MPVLRDFPNPAGRHNCDHSGNHPEVLNRLMREHATACNGATDKLLRKIRDAIPAAAAASPQAHARSITIVVYCKSGLPILLRRLLQLQLLRSIATSTATTTLVIKFGGKSPSQIDRCSNTSW